MMRESKQEALTCERCGVSYKPYKEIENEVAFIRKGTLRHTTQRVHLCKRCMSETLYFVLFKKIVRSDEDAVE